MGEIDDTARRVMRELGYQAEDIRTPDVLPGETAQNLCFDPETPWYELVLNHLLALGDIEPSSDPARTKQGYYRLTSQGLRRAREIRYR